MLAGKRFGLASALVYGLFFGISLLASILGALCDIGGGVLMKPLLDSFGVLPIAAISFLSGCTVLSMSSFLTHTVPPFEPWLLLIMSLGGIGGGILGRKINIRVDDHIVRRLFCGAMIPIIGLCLAALLM